MIKKYTNIIIIIIFLLLEIFLLYDSRDLISDFNKTLNICLYTLMPTMFTSIIITQMLIELNFEKYIPKFIIKFFSKIFNINDKDVIIFILSIISGYPNNSKMLINNKNLNNLILYTNFLNPIFLICTIGNIYLKDLKITIIILISHYLSNILIGVICKNKNIKADYNKDIKENKNYLKIYFNIIRNTISSLTNIFANILFFSILISLINNIFTFNSIFKDFILGLLEFSNGVYLISNLNISLFLKGLFITIIITFGGFSLHMQILSVNEKIKYKKYLLYRIFNVFLAIIIYLLVSSII